MTARAAVRQRDIQKAVAGAIAGGLEPDRFMVEVTPGGTLRILPIKPAPAHSADELDEELDGWRARNGDG